MVKGLRELRESDAFGGDPFRDYPSRQRAVRHHVQLDVESCAQPAPPDVWLDEEVNQVGDKEELKGMQVRFTAATEIFAVRNPGRVKSNRKLRKILESK